MLTNNGGRDQHAQLKTIKFTSIRALKQAKELRINTHTSKQCRNMAAPWDYIWLIGVKVQKFDKTQTVQFVD